MPKNIALVAPRGFTTHCLRGLLSNPIQYSVREYYTMEAVNAGLSSDPFDVLVTRFPRFTKTQVQAVLKLRALFPLQALVSLAPEVDPGARFEVRNLQGHKVLDEIAEQDDLVATIDSVSMTSTSKQRLHPRVRRQGQAEVSEPTGLWRMEASFLDFAQMGARLTLNAGEDIKPKTHVQIAYRSSSDPGRIHRIECLVMWVEGSTLTKWIHGARREIGVRFIAAV
ncbi:MAG: PilZ domain-containing protein [Bdellovibrionota bacterium]